MAASIWDWSVVAANNASADADLTWAEGQAPSTVNNSARVMMQRVRQLITDLGGSIAAGGTANAVTLTASSPFAAYADGQIAAFKATASNSGAATLNVNGIGAKSIRKQDATGDLALTGGEIINGGMFVARYLSALNAAAGGWLLENPTPSNSPTFTSTDAGATAGPTLTLNRNSASPAANDLLGQLLFRGKDSAGNVQDYAQITGYINSPTSTTERGGLILSAASSGAPIDVIDFSASGITPVGGSRFLGTTTDPWVQLALTGIGGTVLFGASTSISFSSSTLSFGGATSGYAFDGPIGYSTGAGGTVTQLTSKSTGVTLNKACGEITMNSAALAAGATVQFTMTNSAMTFGDVLILNLIAGGTLNGYTLNAVCSTGSAIIYLRNNSGGSLSDTPIIRFAVIKGVNT